MLLYDDASLFLVELSLSLTTPKLYINVSGFLVENTIAGAQC